MERRNITIERDDGGSVATFSLTAVLVVVALIALFVWQPWISTTTTNTNRNAAMVTQPGNQSPSGPRTQEGSH
jgi:hypothetical protein